MLALYCKFTVQRHAGVLCREKGEQKWTAEPPEPIFKNWSWWSPTPGLSGAKLYSEIGKGHRPSSHWHMFVRAMVNNLYRTFGNFFWITCHAMNLGMHKSTSSV